MAETGDDKTAEYESRIATSEHHLHESAGERRRVGLRVKLPTAGGLSKSSLKRVGERYALFVAWVILVIIFGILAPRSASWANFASMFTTMGPLIVLTMGLIIPLTTGDLDLSLVATTILAGMSAGLLSADFGWPLLFSMLAALGIGVLAGSVNAFFVLYFRIHSLIVTLGTAAFMTGVTLWISGGMTVIVYSGTLADWVVKFKIYKIGPVFFYSLIVAAIIWYVFEYTTWGRQMLFVGRGREVARLSGIRVARVRAMSFIACGFVSGLAGILFLGRSGAMDAQSLNILLLPAYAAAFLGATAIIPGRFNPWGSVLAVVFLETGIRGFQYMGADTYVQNLFYGGGLLVAVALSQLVRNRERQEFS